MISVSMRAIDHDVALLGVWRSLHRDKVNPDVASVQSSEP